MDIFAATKIFGASNLEPIGSSNKLFTREIGGNIFQFRVLDYRTRFKMGGTAIAQFGKFTDVLSEIFAIRQQIIDSVEGGSDEEIKAALDAVDDMETLQTIMPKLSVHLGDDEIYAYLEEVVANASVQVNGKFLPITSENPQAGDTAFGDNLLLLIPVALSVVEVNCADAFFGQLSNAMK